MAIQFVQKVPNATTPKETNSATSLQSDSFTSTVGNLIVVCVWSWSTTAEATPSFIDSKGNTWVNSGAPYVEQKSGSSSQYGSAIIAAFVVGVGKGGSGHTVTVSGFNSGSEISMGILEFSGVDTSSPTNGSQVGSGVSGFASSGALSPSGNNAYVGCLGTFNVGTTETFTWSSATEAHNNTNVTYATGADGYIISSGSQTATWTVNGAEKWACVIAAFKEMSAISIAPTDHYLSLTDDLSTITVIRSTTIQEGYRFRNDDGTETTATWLANQDTAASMTIDTTTRLRVLLDGTQDPDPANYQLEYRKQGDTQWRKVYKP